MAPAPSKVRRGGGEPTAPHDVVFFLATRQVAPAIQDLLQVLRDSTQGLLDAAARTGSQALRGAVDSVGAAAGATTRGANALVAHGCANLLHAFLCGDGRPITEMAPMGFIVGLIQLLYCAFVFSYMPAAGIAFNSPTSMIFHSFIFLTLASFVKAAKTHPGSVPMSYQWRSKGRPPPMLTERSRDTKGFRWCDEDGCYKPDRAHFCRALGETVLRMDHHCAWLGNTVGFKNHKFFWLFLLYATGACALVGSSILQLLVTGTLPALTSFLLISAEGLAALLGGILGPFLLFHTWLLFENMTTIEFVGRFFRPNAEKKAEDSCPAEGSAEAVKQTPQPEVHDPAYGGTSSPYDQGALRNLCAVLGDNPLLWLLPVGGPSGSGLAYPLHPTAALARNNPSAAVPVRAGPGVHRSIKVHLGGAAIPPVLAATPGAACCGADAASSDGAPGDIEGGLSLGPVESDFDEWNGQHAVDEEQEEEEVDPGWSFQRLSTGFSLFGQAAADSAQDATARIGSILSADRRRESKASRKFWSRMGSQSLGMQNWRAPREEGDTGLIGCDFGDKNVSRPKDGGSTPADFF